MADDQGTSVEERAENGEAEEPMEELFPRGAVDHDGKGPDVIFRKHRNKIETTVALSRAEVPLRGGLPEPDARIRLLVTGEVAHYVPTPTRDEAGKHDGWKYRTVLRSAYVEALGEDADAVQVLYRKVIENEPGRAQALLDKLRSIAEEYAVVS